MTTPQSLADAQRYNPFIPAKNILVLFGAGTYHRCWKILQKTKEVQQGINNLPMVYEDIAIIKDAFGRFNIHDVRLLIDPRKLMVDKVRRRLMKQIKGQPELKFLIVYVFACHGI